MPEDVSQSSLEDVTKARDALKLLRLEKQIIGSALTTIFESEAKGIISAPERVRLVDKYKGNINQLERSIEQHQRTVDLHDLELSRQEIVKDFNTKMSEIDEKLKQLNLGHVSHEPQPDGAVDVPAASPAPVTEAEKRVELIRDEILKAMDRLEQIESEG